MLVIVIASRLLGFNTDRWIHDKTAQAMRISLAAAASTDWSLVDRVQKEGKGSSLFRRYHKDVVDLSQRYFRAKEGSVFVALVIRGEEYDIDNGEPDLDDIGKADDLELAAYSTKKTTYTLSPISDDSGTYVAAFTPVMNDGKVIGLVSAEYDSAPLADFHAIVRSVFWWSVLPAALVSLIISYIFASNFAEPMDVLREIETVRRQSEQSRAADELWSNLTPAQRQVFQLLGQGLKDLEIAEKLTVSLNTVKSHVKSIRAKMRDIVGDNNVSRVDLAIAARGVLQASSSTP